MNVNGSRFELLLGRDDWGRCLDGDGAHARTLGSWWDAVRMSPPQELAPTLPAWDMDRQEIGIRARLIELPATPAETPLSLDARRDAGADRHGNVYRIGDDRKTLVVYSAGSRRESVFWPAEPSDCEEERERARPDFETVAPPNPGPFEEYLALAVTADDYLVVACARGASRVLLSFDLVAGGPPVPTLWPDSIAFEPFDMATRHGGGVWVLDRVNRLLWELDCKLAVVSAAQTSTTLEPGEPDDFQPLHGKARQRAAVSFPGGVELAGSPPWVIDPIAVEMLGEGAVLLLDIDASQGRSRVVRLRRDGDTWNADASHWLDDMPDLAHDFVLARAKVFGRDEPAKQLFIATRSGNQARGYLVDDGADGFALSGVTDLFPLRRFGGRALISIKDDGYYDSGIQAVVWTPIVQLPRAQFESFAQFVTPVFDSFEVGTTWDRVALDACLPPDTAIDIESRAGDEIDNAPGTSASPWDATSQVVGTWLPEPSPCLRSNGAELPWLRREAARATRREAGVGTWDLLLQKATGRYLQLRITLRSTNGTATPRVRALRAWSPRFSYPHRFLPAVYREDASAGPFLERWLANIENTLTGIEDHVVNLQALFDPRIAPADSLAWLASWFEIAFDPQWDERRQRLFVRRAMDFFRWRGTVHGLRLALELAFDDCIVESMFDDPPASDVAGPGQIRIVETYQTRIFGAIAAGDPEGTEAGPRVVAQGVLWTPAEGNTGLVDRYAAALGREATIAEQLAPFSLVPPTGDDAATWVQFCQGALGFVPSAGAADQARWRNVLLAKYGTLSNATLPRDFPQTAQDAADWAAFTGSADGTPMRSLWQDFLARRYRSIERLNRSWATHWPEFDLIALPDALPDAPTAQLDWLQFEGQVLAMQRTAHRFSVLLPVADVASDPFDLEQRLGLARRIVDLEKPAHTVFDVRFYWAFFRIGEARLGVDTQIGAGSRAPELIPDAVLGRAYIGASFVGGAQRPKEGDRLLVAC